MVTVMISLEILYGLLVLVVVVCDYLEGSVE